MADKPKNGGDKKSSQKEVKKVLRDDFKKSGGSGNFEKKWGLPKPPKKHVELWMIGAVAGISAFTWLTVSSASIAGIQIQSSLPAVIYAQMDRRDWLRACYRSCEQWRGWNDWQFRRCRQDCREGR